MINENVLTSEEKASIALRSLYSLHGYQPYKMSKFEEYDFYAHNKDFLLSESIITFNDVDGRLMALKPDVTLSIVRSGRDQGKALQKVYYNENVYRAEPGQTFREIMQVGLECIGDTDELCITEVLRLACESLKTLSPDSIIAISDLDVISAMLDAIAVPDDSRAEILSCIGEKNLHGLKRACDSCGIREESYEKLCRLIRAYGAPDPVLETLDDIAELNGKTEVLRRLITALKDSGYSDMLRIDFSVTGDLRYYNGVVFRGYISGIPTSVITGGQYDRMMKKMGRTSGAVGFAVYLGALERLPFTGSNADVDVVLLYSADDDQKAVLQAAGWLMKAGNSVSLQKEVPDKLRYRTLAKYTEGGVQILEDNA